MGTKMGAVGNILATYKSATPRERRAGEVWYPRAFKWCHALAERTGNTVECVAGVVAALSPGCGWTRNLIEARALVLGVPVTHTTYPRQVDKARAILGGAPVESTLGERAYKSVAFYRNILGFKRGDVCVDRHAIAVALGRAASEGERSLTAVQYGEYVRAYRLAAIKLGVSARTLQAVTWVAWRARKGGENGVDNVPF